MTTAGPMVPLLFDENIDHDILRGLALRLPALDLITVQDAGLSGRPDHEILEWAAAQKRVLVTHDLRTMPRFAGVRVRAGLPMPGVFAAPKTLAIGQVIDDLVLLVTCSLEAEWQDRVVYLPI